MYLSGKNKPEDLLQSQNERIYIMSEENKDRSNLLPEDGTTVPSEREKMKNSEEQTSLFSNFIQRSIQGSFGEEYYTIDEHYMRIQG